MASERVQATINARAAEGKWNGGRVPFGYAYDKDTDSFSIRKDKRGVYRYNYRDEFQKTFNFKDEKDWVLYDKHHTAD